MKDYPDQIRFNTKKDPELRKELCDEAFDKQWSLPQLVRWICRRHANGRKKELQVVKEKSKK